MNWNEVFYYKSIFICRWIYKFSLKKEPYGPAEKEYLTIKAVGFKKEYWMVKNISIAFEIIICQLSNGFLF